MSDLQSGSGHFGNEERVHVAFGKFFQSNPSVQLGMTGFSIDQQPPKTGVVSINVENITPQGFDAVLKAGGGVGRVQFSWVAHSR